jgi:hypothetical protein
LLLILNLLMLVAGMFLDLAASVLIVVPLALPVVTVAGIDPVHFAMIVIVNLMIGGITPPVGQARLRDVEHCPGLAERGVPRRDAVPRGSPHRPRPAHGVSGDQPAPAAPPRLIGSSRRRREVVRPVAGIAWDRLRAWTRTSPSKVSRSVTAATPRASL